jgi:GlpG protein
MTDDDRGPPAWLAWLRGGDAPPGPAGELPRPVRHLPVVTILLIVASIAVAAASQLGASQDVLLRLYIGGRLTGIPPAEPWRLVTPIFIHFGVLHLLVNMWWTWDLGRMIEAKRGHLFLATFVLAVAVPSNLLQYVVSGSPFFGGMSGVVYGLLGYVWMRMRFDPGAGYRLHRIDVFAMLAWFALCWSGLVGSIANWAHSCGLAFGVAAGALEPVGAAAPVASRRASRWEMTPGLRIALGSVVLSAAVWLVDGALNDGSRQAWRYCLAMEGTADEQIDGCARIGEAAEQSEADRAIAMRLLGDAYARRSEYPEAIDAYGRAIALDPTFVAAFEHRGHARVGKGAYGLAIADYDEAIRIDPGSDPQASAGLFNARCWARAIAGQQLADALADCNRAIALRPGWVAALDSRGVVRLKLGALAPAIADFDAALAPGPIAGTLYARGIAKRRQGDPQGGDADVRAALAIAADVADEYSRYGVQ